MSEQDIIVGVTGASGAAYCRALVRELLSQAMEVHFIPTAHASVTWRDELVEEKEVALAESETAAPTGWKGWLALPTDQAERMVIYSDDAIDAPPASGTFRARAMVVVPCSMNTLAKIAQGIADTLLTRSAAVCLKERRPLILVPRETPLSLLDLRNMLAVAEAGAVVLPAMPGFYHKPHEIADLVRFVISKICDQLALPCSEPIRYQKD